jgi:hypothetical protein
VIRVNKDEEKTMTMLRRVAVILVFLAAGCTGSHRAAEKPIPSAPEPAVKPPVSAAPAAVPPPAPKAEADEAKPEAPAPRPIAKTPAEPAPKKEAAPPPAPKPALDLATLEKRLKDTGAIGVFTKLTLKNQVDDLLGKFRAYYKGELKTNLAQLRQPYDLLILKVLSLLQEGDPVLARAVADSREAIWGILSDPEKFRNL